ncbi:hypothetical protein EVAR_9589_1 [Eumeta japonica]|uniref:Reverse transcriptase domain-containing protein n=1 Tax=Eumeta variegata TaxID=151549 RepID=A0A4C1TMN1_EUMVA|nr:hypothetical protein EVAR_9589_1 [Eumeta japonica]
MLPTRVRKRMRRWFGYWKRHRRFIIPFPLSPAPPRPASRLGPPLITDLVLFEFNDGFGASSLSPLRSRCRKDELFVKYLLYANEQVILATLGCGPQEMINKMNDSVEKKSMKINLGKTKVMVFEKGDARLMIYLQKGLWFLIGQIERCGPYQDDEDQLLQIDRANF